MKEEVTLEKIEKLIQKNVGILIKESEDRLEANISNKIDQKINGLQNLMMEGFEIVDKRFDRVETQLNRIEIGHGSRIRALESKL